MCTKYVCECVCVSPGCVSRFLSLCLALSLLCLAPIFKSRVHPNQKVGGPLGIGAGCTAWTDKGHRAREDP